TEPQVFSLPVSTGQSQKTFDIYPEVYNVSVGNAARLVWQNTFASSADVRIAYSYSEASLSSWDGKLSPVPSLSISREGINFVTDYSGCTDSSFRTEAFGPIQAVNDGRCGFLRSEFPFTDGSDVFVRVAGESETTIKLSRVFRIGFSEVTLSSAAVSENAPAGTEVGTLAVSNSDGPSFNYQLSGADASAFTIEANRLKTSRVFDFEAQRNFTITITSVRSDGDFLAKNFIIKVNNVNEAPTSIALSNTAVAENMPAGTAVGTLSVTDPDAGDTFTYELITDAFELTNGKLVTKAPLNFEQKASYVVDIAVEDQNGLQSPIKSFTIAVIDVKEAPTEIILSGNTILENNTIGTEIGTLSTTDSDTGSTHTYTLDGSDSNAFEVVNGKLRAKIVFDFDAKSSYNFFITTRDQDNLTFRRSLTVSVGNLVEPPADIVLSKTSVAENLEAGALVGVLTLLQPETGSTYTYTLGGTDGSSFDLIGKNLVTKTTFDFEVKSSYAITMTATDQNNISLTKPFTLTVTNVNEPISDIVLSNTTVNENAPVGSTVATLTGVNADVGATITYSLGGADASTFAISGSNTLVVAAPINFEAKSSYTLSLTGRDQNNLSFTKSVTLTVLNQNEAPTDITLSANSVSELAVSGMTIGALSTIDPDASNTFTYSLSGPDAGFFSLSSNLLKTAGAFNYEAKSSYALTVTSTDQGALFFTKSFTIQITDANEAPTEVTLSNTIVAENATVVGLVSAVDPDAGNTFTFSVEGPDAAGFNISAGMLVAVGPLDFETQNSFSVTIVAKDQNNLQVSKNVSILITDVNEAPTNLTLSANTLSENALVGSVVGVFTPTDSDFADAFTYTLSGADASAFSIVSGNLTSVTPMNFEVKSAYAIVVTVKDQGDLFFTKNFSITVTNVNEAPTNITLTATALNENLPAGTVVALLSTSDPDFANSHTYTLSGTDAASFTIVGSSLKSAIPFNYENKSSFSLTLRSTDQGGLFFSKNFIVTVNNVDEPSTDILLSSSGIGENLAIGTTVGTLSTLDPDIGSQFTYTLSGIDAASFSIVDDIIKSAEVFNAATKSSYLITVTSTLQSGFFISKNFTINVEGGAVAPTDILLSRNTVWENGGVNAIVGTLSAVDADTPPASMTFSLVAGMGDSDNSLFNIAGNSLRATAPLDFETKSTFSVRVSANDGSTGSVERVFTIYAVDVVEDSYFDNVVLLAHLEGSPGSTTYVDSSKFNRTLTNASTVGHTYSLSKFGRTSLQIKDGYVGVSGINIDSGADFTMEGWWYRTVDLSYGPKMLFYTSGNPDTTKSNTRFTLQDGTATLGVTTTNTSDSNVLNPILVSTTPNVSLNTWNHVALSRQSGMLRLFLNGTMVKSTSCNDCFTNNGTFQFARSHWGLDGGYLDELRVTMDLARYTSNFTPTDSEFPDGNPPTAIQNFLGSTYTQSSENPSGSTAQSSFLTDANIQGSVAATNAETGAWIRVDLRRNYLIDRVVVGTPSLASTAPLNQKSLTENKIVEYSLDGFTWKTAFSTGTLPGFGVYKFDVDFHARYLRIRNASEDSGVLAVSEFYALSPGQIYTPGVFTPRVAVPVAWYDGGDASSVHLDSPTSAGAGVTGWSDKSFWGRHLNQTVGANRPGVARDAFNGRNSLRWPSTDNDRFLEHGGSVTASEIFAVGRFESQNGMSFSNSEGLVSPRNNALLPWLNAFGSSSGFDSSIFSYLFLNGYLSSNRVDSVFPELNSLTLMRSVTQFSNAVTSSNGITVGIDRLQTNLGRGWKGEISELLLFSPPLTTDNRKNVENYLATKWNLSTGTPPLGNPVRFVGVANANCPSTTTAAPAHSIGDLIIVVSGTSDVRSFPDLPGFTVLFQTTPSSANGGIVKVQWKIATSTSYSLSPWGACFTTDQASILVYSNATIGASTSFMDANTVATYPYVNFEDPDTSWALRILCHGTSSGYSLPAPNYFHRHAQYYLNVSDSSVMTTSPVQIGATSLTTKKVWGATIELKRKP
ncbi:MAG: Bifunctional hemolysin/adenylate cyclase precursor, partial [Pseudomonadota bacterium]